jgi:HK97 family phage major capsid protein/HK97 family phage prohead protease
MLNRAYAALVVRSADDEKRTFDGIATTPTTDRMGDTVDPLGAKFKNPLPLLHQHDSTRPIGQVRFKRATPDGIEFSASIPKIAEPGPLKDRVDTAWGEIKAGLVRAVSIGFRVLENGMAFVGDGIHFSAIEIVELSAVTIPANAQATITNIKSFDVGAQAASGLPVVRTRPGVSGSPPKPLARKGAAMPPNASEQIEGFRATMATKVSRMATIMTASNESGETMDAAQAEEYDTLTAEVDALQSQLKRAENLERVQALTATPVQRTVAAPASASDALVVDDQRTGRIEPVVRSIERIDPSLHVARLAKCIVLGRMSRGETKASEFATQMYPNDGVLVEMIKATVAAGTVQDPTWAGALVGPAGLAFAAFLEFLRPTTIIGQFGVNGVPNLTQVPFRTPLGAQTSGGQGYWVGEGHAKPLTKFDFTRTQLAELKVANIAVATKELIRQSSPSADIYIRDGLVAALRERLDIDFINPAKAAVAGVSPASITNGVTGIPSSGTDAAAVRTDIAAMFEAYRAGNNPLSGGVWIMPTALALQLSMMVTITGSPEFPGITPKGGTLFGFPVIASDYVPADTVVLVNAPLVYLADEGGFSVAMSEEASLEMSDAPTGVSGPVPVAPTAMVSMFQTNSVAILAERTINWEKARPNAAVVLTGVQWAV